MLIQGVDILELLDKFIEEQSQLLSNDASEQAISHQLAIKLGTCFPGWDVDCEYNRDMNEIKKLIYAVSPNGSVSERNVVPDIIIHKRMTNENLLAIEVKKSTNPEHSFKDLAKLAAFKEQLGYQSYLFVRFLTGTPEVGVAELECR